MQRFWRPIACLAAALSLTSVVSAQQPLPSFPDVIQSMTAVNASLDSFRVEQEAEARIVFFRCVLATTVHAARPARYHVVVHNPPWFLSSLGNEFEMVARPEDVLTNYTPRTVEWKEEAGRTWLYLSLEEAHEGVNPARDRGAR